MIKNYLKIALRNFLRHKGYTFINVSGLAIGIACCIIIILFVQNELNYDKFHANGDRIYRVLRQANDEGNFRNIGVTSGPYADALLTDYPADIEAAIRVMPNDGLVSYGDKSFREERFYFAAANFFQFFSYPLLEGKPGQVLQDPNSVVISREMARKYFGEEDPIDKVLAYEKQWEFKVTGVFDKFPGNSHLSFDFVASLAPVEAMSWFKRWWNNALFTYVQLKPGIAPQALEAKLPDFMDKYFGDHFRKTGKSIGLVLEPLEDIYFDHEITFDFIPHGDRQIVYAFSAIALLILLIAAINFMNLATARSVNRAMEVGMRKVMGAHRRHLIVQFIGEALALSLVAMFLALVLVEFLLPYCNQLFQLNLSLDYSDGRLALAFLGATLIVGILSGSYPAFFLSAFQPVKTLKGKTGAASRGTVLRKALVALQFGVSVFLVICTLVIFRQLDYVSSKKLGFNKEQVALVRINNSEFRRNRENFKSELLRQAPVKSVSLMSGEPGGFHDNFAFDVEGIVDGSRRLRTVYTDYDYCKTLGLEIVVGRDFSPEYGTDSTAMLLNETAVKSFGWTNDEALGKHLFINLLDSLQRTVIGVVKDYHFTSLKNEIEPLAISIYPDHRVAAIRINPANIREGLAAVEEAWQKAAPGYPFEYGFLDESFGRLYKAEQKQREIFSVFAFIAIFVACLGLFGLATYAAEQRTKEIGIRKVLGASEAGIVALLSKDFLKLVMIGFILAVPPGYYMMKHWLQDFAYRITIDAWIFIMAGVIALLIALATVSYQAIKAALANPVESLRYE